jgi:hypothetical protein
VLRDVSGCTVEQSTKVLEDRSWGIVGSERIAVTMEVRAASSPTQVKIMSDWVMASCRVVTALVLGRVEAWDVAREVVRL